MTAFFIGARRVDQALAKLGLAISGHRMTSTIAALHALRLSSFSIL
jgi:hypothetical protein